MANRTSLPQNPSLDSLKKQAKSLLRAWRQDDPDARDRVLASHPQPDRFSGLRDAQLVLAREYGFPGWNELSLHAEAANRAALGREEQIAAFLDDACLNYGGDHPRRRQRAGRMLANDPSLSSATVHTAAATADTGALRDLLTADPQCVHSTAGRYDWPPLLSLCYARLPEPKGDAIDALRVLLDAGADPNAHVVLNDAYRFSALTGVMGEGEEGSVAQPPHPQAMALAELLIERGASPNESQGLYNTHFSPGNEWIEFFVSKGLSAEDPADPLSPETSQPTLDMLLGIAITYGFTERVGLLLDAGANPNGHDRYEDCSLHENALIYGRSEIADLLEKAGATPAELSRPRAFRAACMAADAARARRLLDADPTLIDDDRTIHEAIRMGSDEAARLVFELGASLTAKGRHYEETPLHQAAISGRAALVEQLLDLGASISARDEGFDATPASWANQGGHLALRDRLLDLSDDVFDLATWGRIEQLERALAADPARARATRRHGVTALHRLETQGEAGARVIDLLLEYGAEIDAATTGGVRPLQAAIDATQEEVAEFLRERGAR